MGNTIVLSDALQSPPRAHGKGGESRHDLLNCIGQWLIHVGGVQVEGLDVGKGRKGDERGETAGGTWSDGERHVPPPRANIALIDAFVSDINRFTRPVSRPAQDAVEMGVHHGKLADAVRVGGEVGQEVLFDDPYGERGRGREEQDGQSPGQFVHGVVGIPTGGASRGSGRHLRVVVVAAGGGDRGTAGHLGAGREVHSTVLMN